MIIFLYGEDSYRLRENRESVITAYRAKHGSGFNFFSIDASAPEATDSIAEAIKSVSLFSEVKLVSISNLFVRPEVALEVQNLIEKYSLQTDPKIVLLATHFGSQVQAKPKELFSILIDKKNLVRNFSALEGLKLQTWLKREASERGSSFGPGAMQKFMALAGADSSARINNLEKLANYAQGQITSEAIDLLIRTETEPNIFEFIDALGSRRRNQAFSLLCAEMAHGREPYYLLTMAMYQFRNMIIVKDMADRGIPQNQIAQKSGLHPFVVKKMLTASRQISAAVIKDIYLDILDLEQGVKQGRRNLEDGLFALTLS